MQAVEALVANQAPSCRSHALAEVDVLAGLERGVESADRLEGLPPHHQVSGPKPGDVRAAYGAAAQRPIAPLHPRNCGRRVEGADGANNREGADGANNRIAQAVERACDPSGPDLVIRI